jgi:hypothetical protein
VNEGESYYTAVLTFAVFWSLLSAGMLLGSAHERNRSSAWFWAASFAASSLAAAYCFGRLIWKGAVV